MEQLINILQLPEKCLLNKKLTKVFFKRNFSLTLSERKLLDDANIVLQMDWIASIKPQNSNIAAYMDADYTFEEIQIITAMLSDDELEQQANKVIDLIQKYIPYPLLLIVYDNNKYLWNTASKRIHLNDATKRTSESSLITEWIEINNSTTNQQLFLQQCAFENLDKHNLKACYQSFESNITSLQAATITGEYKVRPVERLKADVLKMEAIKTLDNEIIVLRNKALKETQLNVQVQINNEVQYKLKQIESLKNDLR